MAYILTLQFDVYLFFEVANHSPITQPAFFDNIDRE